MADDGIYTSNAQIQVRAGVKASATTKAVGETDKYVLDVEALINCLTRFNWSDAFSGLNVDVKSVLTEASACFCAIYVIQADMSSYTSRVEAEDMINILRDKALFAIAILRDKMVQTFIRNA